MSYIYPIILSGGVGSRLWPLSRSHFPKQLLRLFGEHSLVQETALRTLGAGFAKPLIVCHAQHRFLMAQQMQAIGVEPQNIILEPAGRNTAPAAAVAALTITQNDPDAILLLMPADHLIRNQAALKEAITVARDLAENAQLVTFGVPPRAPDTGYGYIQRGVALRNDERAFTVARFVEKPDAETAGRYVKSGDYYWNSGMFVFRAGVFLAELERLQPDILASCQRAIQLGKQDIEGFHLAEDPFEMCKSISIDYAVMEHTDKAAVIPVEMEWSDIGSWSALWDSSTKDLDGNVLKGNILHHGARNSYLRSEGPLLAALGVSDLVVVASPDAVIVSAKSATDGIKAIVERLEHQGRDPQGKFGKIYHASGAFECLDQGENFQVNRITVNSKAILRLEPQHRHGDLWVVVSGAADIAKGSESFRLKTNDVYAPSDAAYQIENKNDVPLHIIETRIQSN